MIKAGVKAENILEFTALGDTLTLALSRKVVSAAKQLEEGIITEVKKHFNYPGDPKKLFKLIIPGKGRKVSGLILQVNYKSVSLGKYPVNQYRITTGKRTLQVTRAKGSAFSRKIVEASEETAIATYVAIRKGRYKLVTGQSSVGHGRVRYSGKGFLHTGTKGHFSAKIFARNQPQTWIQRQRAPIRALFGPSFTDLLKSQELTSFFNSNAAITSINAAFNKPL